jgi:site-specific recombinase XerD
MTQEIITTTTSALADIEQELARDPRLKSRHTRRGYLADLTAFDAWRQGRPATKLMVEEYAASLQATGSAPNSINRKLAAIRWYARRLAEHIQEEAGLEEVDRARMVSQAERVATVQDVTGKRQQKGRHISPGELSGLMEACANDPSNAGRRDAALFAVAWQAGLRRDELGGLTTSDFAPAGPEDGDLVIRGKGDKERAAYLYDGAHQALTDWLAIRGSGPGPIFCAIRKDGLIHTDRHLSGEALRMILDKRIAQAGVKPLTWHDFRRTFAGNLLDGGADLVTVQKLMGHSDPGTTSNYDRRGDEVKRKAVKTLFVPYHGRQR